MISDVVFFDIANLLKQILRDKSYIYLYLWEKLKEKPEYYDIAVVECLDAIM